MRFLDLLCGPLRSRPVQRLTICKLTDRVTGAGNARTQPFSMTKLNARTTSSIGTNQRGVNTWVISLEVMRTCVVRAVREDHIDVLEL